MKELRYNNQCENSTESRKVEGYAIVFDSLSNPLQSNIGEFKEIICRGAITEETINNSDILFFLNHSEDRGLLARSKYGNGSLQITIDERGVKYSFDAPKTNLGDEVLEGIRRGDISNCSFAFTIAEDRWVKQADGTIVRYIDKIKELFDFSVVYKEAYSATEVNTRGLKALLDSENNSKIDISNVMNKRSKEEILEQLKALMVELETEDKTDAVEECNRSEEEENKDEETSVSEETEKTDETEVVEEKKDEEIEQKSADVEDEETSEETEETEQVESDETDENKNEEYNNKEERNNSAMKKFSLIKTINDVVNNRSLSNEAVNVIKEGRSAMAKAGLATSGSIVLPVSMATDSEELRANGVFATVAASGKENIATDKLDILEPLRANMVLAEAGATYLTGLKGNVSIPRYGKTQAAWKGETVAADNGAGSWDEVNLEARRLTAFVDVSRQFLVQDSNDAEEMLKRDIIKAIADKLEATILGDAAGDANKPAGMFEGVTADTTAIKFEGICDMEADLEDKNVNDYCYIVAPTAKAVLRKTSKDTGSGRFIMEDGEIEGRKVLVSSNVTRKGVIVGNFEDYVIAQWGGLDLTIDNISKATEGLVRIVINAYFDAKPRRDSFVKRILK